MASNNPLRGSRSARIASDPSGDDTKSSVNPPPPTVTFGRRTLSGRYISYSRDDLDSELGSGSFSKEFLNYHVHIPPTPDNQPMAVSMDPSISAKVEEQYVSNSLFTGGFNSVTRAHLMDKVTETNNQHPQMAGSKGSSCAIHGCDGKVMCDERGVDILPCECDYKICVDCFVDAVKSDGAVCPGCKEPYKATEVEEGVANAGVRRPALSLPPPPGGVSKMERRLSMMKSRVLSRSQTGDFDHNRWLFETKGTYGYGNAIWPKEGGGGGGDSGGEPAELTSKPWRPLTRKLKVPAAVLSPYR